MRIISQDGTIDVSYENGSLSMSCGKYKDVECARIYYYNPSCPRGTLLAEYKSKAKAIKAMEMLHNEWLDYGSNGLYQFPKDEEIEVEDE